MAKVFGTSLVIGTLGGSALWLLNKAAFASYGPLLLTMGGVGFLGLLALMWLHQGE